jgi:gluconolactonase
MSTWQPSPRYPDPSIVSIDPSFDKYRLALSKVERLATGMVWSEGPVWLGDARKLVWSDVPGNCMYQWDEATGAAAPFRQPSNNANGNEHLTRRVTRTEHDGRITVLADSYGGKRLNSPNDIVVKSDNSVWFTDPSFGILSNYEGEMATPELPTNVYRIDADGSIGAVAEGINQPNGLAFSPDETILYIVESRTSPRTILAYNVVDGKTLAGKRIAIDAGPGTPDGFRLDVDGNLWCGWGMGAAGLDGVHIFNPQGKLIGRIDLPERCANLCFGGVHRNRLFMAASTSLYSLYVNTQGVGYA